MGDERITYVCGFCGDESTDQHAPCPKCGGTALAALPIVRAQADRLRSELDDLQADLTTYHQLAIDRGSEVERLREAIKGALIGAVSGDAERMLRQTLTAPPSPTEKEKGE